MQDRATGAAVGNCSNPVGLVVRCTLFGGRTVAAGAVLQITFADVTSPASGGPHRLSISTTSDTPAVSSPDYTQGGEQPPPEPTPRPRPTPTPTATPVATVAPPAPTPPTPPRRLPRHRHRPSATRSSSPPSAARCTCARNRLEVHDAGGRRRDPAGLDDRCPQGGRRAHLALRSRRPAAEGALLRGHVRRQAGGSGHRAHAQRAARLLAQGPRGPEAQTEVPQAAGRRQGQVPDQGLLRRRHRPGHQVARPGHLHDDARPGHAGPRLRPRQRQAQDDHPACRQALHRARARR